MPEGPEVKIITDWLCQYTGCQILNNSKYSEINGLYINKIHCKGKQIFFILQSVNGLEKKYINIRLGMTGRWSLSNEGHVRFWMVVNKYNITMSSDLKTNIIDENIVIYNSDTRNFGTVDLITNDEYIKKLNDIGPDLLSENIDLGLWEKKIKNGRIKGKKICDYLLEQKYFSGIGNYLKSEILYRCKIRPDKKLCELTDQEIKLLLIISIETIKESYKSGGLTIRDFWSPIGNKGIFNCFVYNKDKDPYGNEVIVEKFNGGANDRSTYWCPTVQK